MGHACGRSGLRRERNDAERAIRRLAGVVGVINEITIRKRDVNATLLREEIEFVWSVAPIAEANARESRLRMGQLWKSVELHSWQRRAGKARQDGHSPGVTQVRDHVRIDPYF